VQDAREAARRDAARPVQRPDPAIFPSSPPRYAEHGPALSSEIPWRQGLFPLFFSALRAA
jgi:hypothetical protein